MKSYRDRVLFWYAKERANGVRPNQAIRIAKWKAKYAEGRKCPFDNRWGYAGSEVRKLPNGWSLKFTLEYDSDCGPPEKECDGHGPTQWVHHCLEDWERDWVLCWDGYSKLLYDVREARKQAKRDGWCMAKSDAEIKVAVQGDFDYLYGYYNDDWHYVGIVVELLDENDVVIDEWSCWGFETSDPMYLDSEARDEAAYLVKKHYPAWRKQRRIEREECHWHMVMELGG